MAWLPDGKKFLMIHLFVLTQLTNVTNTQTDRQTLHNSIGRAYAKHRAAKTIIIDTGRECLESYLVKT